MDKRDDRSLYMIDMTVPSWIFLVRPWVVWSAAGVVISAVAASSLWLAMYWG